MKWLTLTLGVVGFVAAYFAIEIGAPTVGMVILILAASMFGQLFARVVRNG